jgi:mannose-1-phosphate guanylyltransferase/mannose-6-phosphate isomerase
LENVLRDLCMKVIVLAGGKGSRLWPLSQPNYPKPLLRLAEGYSFLQRTLLRFLGSYPSSSLAVVFHQEYKETISQQCLEIAPKGDIVLIEEKVSRSTTIAAALGILALQEKGVLKENEPVLLSPSDARIFPLDIFLEEISFAQEALEKGYMAIFGVTPTHIEPSYGYIQAAEKGVRLSLKKQFIEKPSYEKTQELMKEGDLLWNTGHILLTPKIFWGELEQYCSQIASLRYLRYEDAVNTAHLMLDISLDHALLEPSLKVLVSRLDVNWSDMGTWDRIYEAVDKNNEGNVFLGNSIDVGSKNCLIVSNGIKVVTFGLEELIVVATEEGVLITKKGCADQIKGALSLLQKEEICAY